MEISFSQSGSIHWACIQSGKEEGEFGLPADGWDVALLVVEGSWFVIGLIYFVKFKAAYYGSIDFFNNRSNRLIALDRETDR